MNDEPDWRRLLASQKSQEREHAPALEQLLSKARRVAAYETAREECESGVLSFFGRPRVALATAAAAVALTLTIGRICRPHFLHSQNAPSLAAASREEQMREIEQALAALKAQVAPRHALISWQSPTDFLLNPALIETP